MRKRKEKAWESKHTTLSVKAGSVKAWACIAASGTGSLTFIDVTADQSSRIKF